MLKVCFQHNFFDAFTQACLAFTCRTIAVNIVIVVNGINLRHQYHSFEQRVGVEPTTFRQENIIQHHPTEALPTELPLLIFVRQKGIEPYIWIMQITPSSFPSILFQYSAYINSLVQISVMECNNLAEDFFFHPAHTLSTINTTADTV